MYKHPLKRDERKTIPKLEAELAYYRRIHLSTRSADRQRRAFRRISSLVVVLEVKRVYTLRGAAAIGG